MAKEVKPKGKSEKPTTYTFVVKDEQTGKVIQRCEGMSHVNTFFKTSEPCEDDEETRKHPGHAVCGWRFHMAGKRDNTPGLILAMHDMTTDLYTEAKMRRMSEGLGGPGGLLNGLEKAIAKSKK